MTDESKLINQANRGERAKRIIEDPIFIECFEKIERHLIDAFKDSKIGDDDGRRHTRESLGLLTRLRQEMTDMMITGNNARKELTRVREESKLRRVFNGR